MAISELVRRASRRGVHLEDFLNLSAHDELLSPINNFSHDPPKKKIVIKVSRTSLVIYAITSNIRKSILTLNPLNLILP